MQLVNINKALVKQSEQDPQNESIYRSVPGIGVITSRILATELGDMKRFHNIRGLFSYLGLTPCEYSSGEHAEEVILAARGWRLSVKF